MDADIPGALRDVLKQCQLLRELNHRGERNFTISDMASETVSLILPIWHRANAKLAQPPVCVEPALLALLARRIESKWLTLASIANKRKVN